MSRMVHKVMLGGVALTAVCAAPAADGPEPRTPETSSLFVRYEDPESHVVSYLLRPKSFAWNQQSIYFTTKSMTDDGRFLVFDYADDEFQGRHVSKHKAVVDFLTDTIVALPGTTGNIPYLDTATDRLYYTSPEGVWRHDLLVSPTNRTLVCPWPQGFLDLAKRFGEKRGHLATHPTLTQDKRKMFIDSRYGDTFFHGMLDLEKGTWEHWGETPFFMNHGQVCPSDDNLAMGAWEVDWVDSKGEHHPIHNIGPDKRYPRMWYLKPGNVREMIDPGPAMNYATHEMWDEDGHGHYWNNWTGLWHYDRFTKETSRLSPFPAGHSVVSRDMRYQVSDFPVGWGYWRGNFWNVVFRDGRTGGAVFIHTFNDALCPPTNQSKLHPDTHPCFVAGERYILTTLCSADGHMDLCLTPTAPLKALCAKPTPLGTPLPASAHPIDVGERIGQQYFRATSEDRFRRGKSPELFAAILEYARLTGNHRLPYDNDGLRFRARNAERMRAKNKIPYAPDPAAVEAVSLIRAVLAGDASKRDAARAAWTKVASPETPQDWCTVMEGVNLLVAADTTVTSVPLRVLTPVPGERVSLTTPVTLRWYGDMPEEGFRVIVRRKGVEKPVVDQTVRENRLELRNLEVARAYTWTVRAGKKYVMASFDTGDPASGDMKPADDDPFANLPAEAAPERIGRRVIGQLLRTRPDNYDPPGYTGKPYGQCITLTYSVASLWANAIRFAQAQRDEALVKRLTDDFEPYFPGGERAKSCHTPYHVDDNIVGVVPYAVYRVTRDPRAVKMGDLYADTQWAAPCEAVYTKYHALPRAKIDELWAKGYSPLTRLWIDDMYMIIALQEEAARIHRDRTYLDRAAHEMCLYLDELQIKDGPSKGLFYHAPDTPFIWGRGCGWMAAGMALVLAQHPDEPDRAKIMDGYRAMMAALLRYQREDGLWGQLVNEPTSWGESSGTAMFTYAFVVGVRNGWLDPKTYGAAARKAYLKLCSSLDAYGNVPSVCIGTGKKNDHQYYLDRERITGDSHGQAPLLWTVNALLGVE